MIETYGDTAVLINNCVGSKTDLESFSTWHCNTTVTMACYKFEIIPISKNSIYNSLAIMLLITYSTYLVVGDQLTRAMNFKANRLLASDDTVCSTDTQSQILSEHMSRIKCALACLSGTSCLSFNWNEPSTCELFFFKPKVFAASTNCTSISNFGKTYMYVQSNNINLLFIHTLSRCKPGDTNHFQFYWRTADVTALFEVPLGRWRFGACFW